jgi:hypothetical protein
MCPTATAAAAAAIRPHHPTCSARGPGRG